MLKFGPLSCGNQLLCTARPVPRCLGRLTRCLPENRSVEDCLDTIVSNITRFYDTEVTGT